VPAALIKVRTPNSFNKLFSLKETVAAIDLIELAPMAKGASVSPFKMDLLFIS
jgi:hypothetical protein